LYSFRDLVSLKLIRSLLDNGMSLQRVRRAFEYLRKRAGLDEQLSEVSLVTDGQSVFEVGSPDQVADALKHGQLAFCFALNEVATTTDTRADHLYDRKGFVDMVRRVGSDLEREMSSTRPLQAAR
jgi:DNA-binding transcriptional MerR regulator